MTRLSVPDIRAITPRWQQVAIAGGTVYRLGRCVQVWWARRGGDRECCETWRAATVSDAIMHVEAMRERRAA